MHLSQLKRLFFSATLQHLLAECYLPPSQLSSVDIPISVLLKLSESTFSDSVFKLDCLWWNWVSISCIHIYTLTAEKVANPGVVRLVETELLPTSILCVCMSEVSYWLTFVCQFRVQLLMGELSLFCDCEAPSRTSLLFGHLLHFCDIYDKFTGNEHKMNKTLLCDSLSFKIKLLLVFTIS